jgi:cyclopropane fatty-acyl-phospholipid synthase-like methyltransferase
LAHDIYTSGEYLAENPSWHAEDSPWKAAQVYKMIERNKLHPKTIAEIGCGAGAILDELSKKMPDSQVSFSGYDISPQAIEMANKLKNPKLSFHVEDLLSDTNKDHFDLMLVIDVFEHVPDYIGFVKQCKAKAEYKMYHIPLDIHISSVVRNAFHRSRYSLGHLHYFNADSALATLRDTDQEIVDYFYTGGALGLFNKHVSLKTGLANIPRLLLSKLSVGITAHLLGGYSLMVLTR